MSSCFLCDTSYKFTDNDRYNFVVGDNGPDDYKRHFMKYRPIMVGSSGTNTNDQQHDNSKKQNYVSYRVKKIEFRASVIDLTPQTALNDHNPFPDYIILFKVPFREFVFDYYFTTMSNFMLYSEPENVLTYGVYNTVQSYVEQIPAQRMFGHCKYDLNVYKPFIVGPNDYVGVLYMFDKQVVINASAKVWFDIV